MRPQADAIRREYGFLSAWYDRVWSRYIRRSVALTVPHINVDAGQHILDVGCGTGQLLDVLARRTPGATLVGVDLTPAMLHVAHRRLRDRGDVIAAEASGLPFPQGTFHVVVSTSVLHYLREPRASILEEWRRCSRPGGTLVVTDWCRDYASMRVLDRLLRSIDPAHNRALTVVELRSALIEAGYTDVNVTRHRMGWFWGMMVASAAAPAE